MWNEDEQEFGVKEKSTPDRKENDVSLEMTWLVI